MTDSGALDLNAYMTRIDYSGSREAALPVLAAVHRAHLAAIPFENLDVLRGRTPRLDLPSLEEKLVRSRRGGYCFEHNTLFAAVLGALGFQVTCLEARVRPPGATRVLPRTHMVLRVDLDRRELLADVGFGGDGPLEPVPMDGTTVDQSGELYRVVEEGRLRVLQRSHDRGWRDLYAFTLEEALPVDFEVANHYTSTYPQSPFVTTLTAQVSPAGERRILRHRTLTVRRDGVETVREVADHELSALLAHQFGIEQPAG